ncbi:MAG: hypothetical protein HY287_11750 [Planctomycetes bacterium]|nr:hypothetical protein [Planctomycetota bacterium]
MRKSKTSRSSGDASADPNKEQTKNAAPRRVLSSSTDTARNSKLTAIEVELRAMLAPLFEGITVSISSSTRWNRPAATFTWSGFKGLLPEERFHRLMTVISEGFKAERMAGFIWLELAPGESIDELLKMPRSDDVAAREGQIVADLSSCVFFATLAEELGASPQRQCQSDFRFATKVLSSLKFDAAGIRDAKLVFIRHHAFCDCAILESDLGSTARKNSASGNSAKRSGEQRRIAPRSQNA